MDPGAIDTRETGRDNGVERVGDLGSSLMSKLCLASGLHRDKYITSGIPSVRIPII